MLTSSMIFKLVFVSCLTSALMLIGLSSCRTAGWTVLTTEPETQGPRPISDITELTFTDLNQGWAITPLRILKTTDGGYTWTQSMEGEDDFFHSVVFVNPSTGWVVGSNLKDGISKALILHTQDGGKTWRRQALEASTGLQGVSFHNSVDGWAVGSQVILHTNDGGITWDVQYESKDKTQLLSVVAISSQSAFTVGEDGIILRTENGGKTWMRQDVRLYDALYRVRFFGESGWIVGSGGTLLRTTNAGATWQLSKLDNTRVLTDIYVSAERGWITGPDGTFYLTRNGGDTWEQQKAPTSVNLLCLFFINPHKGWAGGDKGTVLSFSG